MLHQSLLTRTQSSTFRERCKVQIWDGHPRLEVQAVEQSQAMAELGHETGQEMPAGGPDIRWSSSLPGLGPLSQRTSKVEPAVSVSVVIGLPICSCRHLGLDGASCGRAPSFVFSCPFRGAPPPTPSFVLSH